MRTRLLRNFATFLALFSVLALAGCSGKSQTGDPTVVPNLRGPEVTANEIPAGTEKIVEGPSGSGLRVLNLGGKSGGKLYLEVEGTLSNASYSQIRSQGGIPALKAALEATSKEMKKAGAIMLYSNAEAAYLSFYIPYSPNLLSALKSVKFYHEFYFSPVNYDVNALTNMKTYRASAEGFTLRSIGRGETKGFSGLERMNAVAFAKLAASDIGPGEVVDGSSVRVGVTDTGITFNHPTFLNSQGKNRIVYMKDFTREGRAYFNPNAKFQATALGNNEFEINAEALVSPKLPVYPNPEKFTSVEKLKIKVSPEIASILTDATKKVVFGFMSEDSFNGDSETVDINANGKIDDLFPMIYVVGAEVAADRVFIAFDGKGDFTNSPALGNFNTSGDTVKVYSEKVGFELKADGLPKEGAEEIIPLRSASIVGFDPGNHGSHVSGIAAGRKTISSEPEETLARGVAPNAAILMDRVCANNGGCGTSTKAIVDLVMNAGVDVVNMSLGGLNPFNDGYGVEETIVNRLVSLKNAVFMISAGNSGPGRQTLGSPSTARLSLSIGASASRGMIQRQYQYPGLGTMPPSSADDDFMLFFSSRGPTANGAFKPNIVAPGTELSSVQLNAAPGSRSGLDVYWGTSMAAPSATGAFALLLDAVKKYNLTHADHPMPTNAVTLRQVMIGSARKFGQEQYSWIDEGTGIIDLVAAWETLKSLALGDVPTGVKTASGQDVPLDYQVLTSFVAPNGIAYNGSRAAEVGQPETVPAFGAGLYVDANGSENFMPVYISRRLTEEYAASPEAGDLEVQLKTSAEEFVLKSEFGQDPEWFKAGTLAQIGCLGSETENLTILGRGAEIIRKEDGTGEINAFAASTLNVCLDRALMKTMKAGDHGALIYAYRTKDGKMSPIPSFVVPVYFTQVHQALAQSTAYSIQKTITSFGVDRNYVTIPVGTSVAQITLSVDAFKEGGNCSGVELMPLFGGNTKTAEGARSTRRVSNCSAKTGAPELDPKKRKLVITRVNPIPGVWDIDVFGQYQFTSSDYSLRVDYIVGETSVKEIQATPATLKGSFQFSVKEASVPVKVDQAQSTFQLTGLYHQENAQVAKEEKVIVGGPLGQLRQYPAGIESVMITTGGSPGNDIDLDILECPLTQTSLTDFSACETVGESGGATDVEKAGFKPKTDKKYAVRVSGYAIKDEGKFFQGEELVMKSEAGNLAISGAAPVFDIGYDFSASLSTSAILNSLLFTSGQFKAQGSVKLMSEEGTLLGAVRALVSN